MAPSSGKVYGPPGGTRPSKSGAKRGNWRARERPRGWETAAARRECRPSRWVLEDGGGNGVVNNFLKWRLRASTLSELFLTACKLAPISAEGAHNGGGGAKLRPRL